jgi:glycosyltransferase involved in cell wall biosynthesis
VRELLRGLAYRSDRHRYRCYARTRWERPLDERFSWELTNARDPLWHLLAARSASRDCDVFLSSNSYLTVPMLSIPAVAIVYDLVTFDRSMSPNRRSLVIERLMLGAAVRHACRLLCISTTTADALRARFPGAEGKITVVPLGVSADLSAVGAEVSPGLPSPGFVLAVGTLEPRKNLPRLVAAYASLPRSLQGAHPLVLAGAKGWDTGPTLAAISSLGDCCVALGEVSDADLAELYRRCAVFCYPSLGEGFGLPVLEAMAAGAAVITSNLSALPEVGGEAVEYVDPRSVERIAAVLERLLSDPERREELSVLARRRAAEFSWHNTAAITLAALEQAAESAS